MYCVDWIAKELAELCMYFFTDAIVTNTGKKVKLPEFVYHFHFFSEISKMIGIACFLFGVTISSYKPAGIEKDIDDHIGVAGIANNGHWFFQSGFH
jgi:hypothetical protein